MLTYYYNLEEDKNRTSDIKKTAEDSFIPFEKYLKNVLYSVEKREKINAKWRKINFHNSYQLCLIGNIFEFENKNGLYKIELENQDVDIEESLIYFVEGKKYKIKITPENIRNSTVRLEISGVIEKASLDGCNVKLTPLKQQKLDGIILEETIEKIIVYIENDKQPNGDYKPIRNITPYIDFDKMVYECGDDFVGVLQIKNDLIYEIEEKNITDEIVKNGNLKFSLRKKQEEKGEERFRIQLIEKNDDITDGFSFDSPLKYFFDDDISIKDSEDPKIEYIKKSGNESDFTLILSSKDGKPCFPKSDEICVEINTYQIRKQLESVSTLKLMPLKEHRNLIRLFEDREKTKWKQPKKNEVDNWIVLTDETRDGCKEQRNFVNQALNTPDFAILEGPPGSGKTTVILELICQLAQKGKRVLLCGSTHIAIDNVLERLDKQNLLAEYEILPIRIGESNRLSDDVKQFQLNNFINENINDIEENLLLEISNLVCGTTIGILQHPKFKERKSFFKNNLKTRDKYEFKCNEPIIPEFDYLIIDESSKTTFQEFLVPALYAKKWILVGDIKQLSPFTDRNEIVSNIENLNVGKNIIDGALQKAVFYLQKLKSSVKTKNNRFIVPVTEKELEYIQKELENGRKDDFEGKILIGITENLKEISHNFIIKSKNQVVKLELVAYDIIFVDRNIFNQMLNENKFPETHSILLYDEDRWIKTEHAFLHNSFYKNRFRYKDDTGNNSFEICKNINEYFKEKSWAGEIAWKIDRKYQLRQLSKNIKYEDLLPTSIDIKNDIELLKSMAFPSILESLVSGTKSEVKINSTISEGFQYKDLDVRRTTLTYQHRMHPDISVYPREQFYTEEHKEVALKDLQGLAKKREWKYNKYKKRSVWIDIKGQVNKNINEKESEGLIEELKLFIEFAKNNPHPQGDEWSAACLTFYRGQEKNIREKLRNLTGQARAISNFSYTKGKYKINIKLHTVDKFQGQEADIVFLSMVQNRRDGFLDSPNRLNVALTRAKFQLVILGDKEYFLEKSKSEELKRLAQKHKVI